MLHILPIPVDPGQESVLEKCLELRGKSFRAREGWIGHTHNDPSALGKRDNFGFCHIVETRSDRVVSYARIDALQQSRSDCSINNAMLEAARHQRLTSAPCLQLVSIDNGGCEATYVGHLTEIVRAAFRFCNGRGIRCLLTVCDRLGSKRLNQLGMRYSTVSRPFETANRRLAIVSIPVTNANYASLKPLRVISPSEENNPPLAPAYFGDADTFGRMDVLAELVTD